ncbi:hypothetical protein ACEPAI_8486 [Sanghuangporus weigelae]
MLRGIKAFRPLLAKGRVSEVKLGGKFAAEDGCIARPPERSTKVREDPQHQIAPFMPTQHPAALSHDPIRKSNTVRRTSDYSTSIFTLHQMPKKI